jgi:hypothetical protein
MQCLMLETKDQRRFFTHKRFLPNLVEFCRTFDSEISVVKLKEKAEVLDLVELAPAICDANYNQEADYEIVEEKISRKNRKPVRTSDAVRQYVRDRFSSGDTVELQQVAQHFKDLNVGLSSFCKHIAYVRNAMEKEGHQFVKMGGGKYRLR